MVSACPLISKSSSSFTNPLEIVPSTPIMIGITVTFIFPSLFSFFCSLATSRYLSFFSLSFNFTLWSSGTAKSTIWLVHFILFYLFILILLYFSWLSLSLAVWLFIPQNPRELCTSHSPGRILGCVYTTCSYGHISISRTILGESPSPPSRV